MKYSFKLVVDGFEAKLPDNCSVSLPQFVVESSGECTPEEAGKNLEIMVSMLKDATKTSK